MFRSVGDVLVGVRAEHRQHQRASERQYARAELAIGTETITFNDADPDVVTTITSAPVSLDVKARTTAGGAVTLTVQAAGNFTNGSSNIPLNTLQWTATGTGYQAGSSDSTNPQTVGTWTGSGHRVGRTRCPTPGRMRRARIT